MKVKVTLSIGLAGCTQEDEIEIPDDEIPPNQTDEQMQEFLHEQWKEWAWNYIDGGATIIEE